MARMARAARQITTRVLLALILILIGSYMASRQGVFEWPRRYDPLAIPDLAETPHWLTDYQFKLVDFDFQGCVSAINRAGVRAAPLPAAYPAPGCERTDMVKLPRLSRAAIDPEEMRCSVAARLYMWERHVLQPAARRFLGEEIARVEHFGSYSCRTISGRSSMSQHATANAFDISGFRTASGRQISLKRDWQGADREARFLRVARDGLCDWFNLTLSPDYNEAHEDHFHVDMGWYRSCR
jgi:hypothetical protein